MLGDSNVDGELNVEMGCGIMFVLRVLCFEFVAADENGGTTAEKE